MEYDIEKRLKDAQDRVAKAVAATSLLQSPEGKLLLDYISERISYLVNKLTASEPVTTPEYLDIHGSIRELQTLNTMLHSASAQGAMAQEEADALRQNINS